jgi:hypothetical protein
MYYLSGSDYYLNTYLKSKRWYKIMYVMRKGDEEAINQISPNTNEIQIRPDSSDVSLDLSSTKIKKQILSLVADNTRKQLQKDILSEVGVGVYCRLQTLQIVGSSHTGYLVPSNLYGNLCGRGASPTASIPPPPARALATGSYPFLSVPIKNKAAYCYQNAAFQLLFSIDSIRREALQYEGNGRNVIMDNAFQVLKRMNINRQMTNPKEVINEINQDILATTLYHRTDTQEDSMLFLNSLIANFIGIITISNEITFQQATFSFCEKKNSQMNNPSANDLMNIGTDRSTFEQTIFRGDKITSEIRRNIMNISPDKYNSIGILININGITSQQIFMCENTEDMVNSTIQEMLNSQYSVLSRGSNISGVYTGSSECGQIRQKLFIKIPDTLKYICFNKRVLPRINDSYTFQNCKDLTINGIKFELKGYISHLGDIRFNGDLIEAKSGHYLYVGIENGRQVLYNDSAPPEFISDSMYIRRGYVFLYKRVDVAAGDGSGAGAGVRGGVRGGVAAAAAAAARGGNLTKKYNKSSTFDVNKKTRKTNNKNNHSPKSPKGLKNHKNKTQHFKIVRNGNNNTRKK